MEALYADASISSSKQKSPPTSTSGLPAPAQTIFYDLLREHKRDFPELSSRCILGHDVAKLAKNYCFNMFKIAHLKYLNVHNGTIRDYQCR